MRSALSDQQVAALAAGGVTVEAQADPTPAPVAPVITPEPTPITAQAQTPTVTADAVVTLLQGQLATAQAQVVALSVDLQTVKATATADATQSEAMRPIVRAAVSNLRVALGGTAAGVDAMSDATLLAEHANLAAQFNKKFKAGGVAAVSSSASKESQVVELDPLRKARLAAVRIGK